MTNFEPGQKRIGGEYLRPTCLSACQQSCSARISYAGVVRAEEKSRFNRYWLAITLGLVARSSW